MIKEAFDTDIRIGMCPDMNPTVRHGSIWFDVSGFGRLRRDFVVNHPDKLFDEAVDLARGVARQVMILDHTLPKKISNCRPVKIDIRSGGKRRVYNLDTLQLIVEDRL